MEKIASFQVDHIRLIPGVYVSRRDMFGETALTTFDLRFKTPNKEPVIDMPALHTLEHLGATFLRSHKEWAKRVVYFGPMGCRTGFYLILAGELEPDDVLPLLREFCAWTLAFEGEIPGAKPAECGNYSEQNLAMAKWEAARYLVMLENPKPENLRYPV
jgi:S-ribosylhomocysteine lyase